MMQANARAIAAGEKLVKFPVDNVTLNSVAMPYKLSCWLWLKQMFAELPEQDREALRPLLEESGFWPALAFEAGEEKRVPVFGLM
jgi:hypothetical protein